MSRLYGRTDDIYNISKYFRENYKGKYIKDKTPIKKEELENAPSIITPYISLENAKYLDSKEIEMASNAFLRETIYSGPDEEKSVIIFPSRKLREEYKRELLYFLGDLLRRKSLDYMPSEFDIKCQYSDVLPLLIEYLYLRDTGKADRFEDKHLSDLNLNAKEYIKMFEGFNKCEGMYDKDFFLRNTLLYLVPLASMDATLQIRDTVMNDKDELIKLIDELITNENHNREEILRKRDIDSYGFKALRKEIKNKRGSNE